MAVAPDNLVQCVYDFIASRGSVGATDEEVQTALSLNPSTVRWRRMELLESSAIVASGLHRKTIGRRNVAVWVASKFSKEDRKVVTDKPRFESVRCDKIKCSERSRKEMGDLKPLADSILQLGLLHPIVITTDHELVCGERRLRAVRDVLHENVINAKIIDLGETASVDCEHDENELRKAFTPSERVAIAAKRREQIGSRQGQRTDKGNELVPKCAQVEAGKKTRETVAELAGFDSHATMERAEKVVASGCEELVDAMDAGTVSISKAAELAKLPATEQRAAIAAQLVSRITGKAATKQEAKKTVGKLAESLAQGEFDEFGRPHQKKLKVLYSAMKEIGKIVTGLNAQADAITEARKTENWDSHTKTRLRETLAGVQRDIKQLDRFLK